MGWLDTALTEMSLREDCESYLLRRGAKRESFEKMGEVTWEPPSFDIPSSIFCRRYGIRGEKLDGFLVCPLYSPKGNLLGFEARSTTEKKITRHLLPQAEWNPVWLAHKGIAEKIWSGGSVWLVEGHFDLYAMEWVVPKSDAILCSVTASLTPYHLTYLQRMQPNTVYVVYDNDEVGKKGSFFAERALKKLGLDARIINFFGGKDPNDIWRRGGLQALRQSFQYQIGGLLWQ